MLKKSANNYDFLFETAIYGIILFITGLVLPFILIFVIHFTGQSEIVEEIAKAAVVLFIVLRLSRPVARILGAIMFGFLFGFSESVLYLINYIDSGNIGFFWQRFLLAVPMHMVTVLLVLAFCNRRKWLVVPGLALAIVLHLLFNQMLAE